MLHCGGLRRRPIRGLMQLKASSNIREDDLLNTLFDLKGFELACHNKLSKATHAFFAGGAGEGITLNENVYAFDDLKLLPRVLRDVQERSLSTTLLNQRIDFPLLIAPMAFQCLAHPEGEVATAKAAQEHNIPMVVSTCSTCSFEEIKVQTTIAPWLQLYIYKDREITKNLIQLAEASGYKGIVLTVDAPLYGKRINELHHPLTLPLDFEIKNLQNAGLNLKNIPSKKLANTLAFLLDPSLTWNDIDWLRSITRLPLILKGVMNPKDIQIAVMHDIETLIISNHGGRQLDTSLSALETLKLMRGLDKGKMEFILDGGIRKGTDILKALALGAKAVMVGRPILWGLSVGGEEGVKKVLDILKAELDLAMALCGYTSINQINEEVLYFPG